MHLFLDIPNVIVANNKANLHILQLILVHPVGAGKNSNNDIVLSRSNTTIFAVQM